MRSFRERAVKARCSASPRPGVASRPQRHRLARLAFEPLESRRLLDAGPLVISELMAINDNTLNDENGDYSDWIEIHNPTDAPVNLDQWSLTDDPNNLTKWRFPDASLGPEPL